jgi:Cu(I)/Ag(I) efflux system membrane protein CusA/SilA
MLVYLNNSLHGKVLKAKEQGKAIDSNVVEDAVYDGAVLRLRPKLMTVIVDILGLLPVLLATGPGSDVMKPITIPFVFGLITSTLFVLIVLPVMYSIVRVNELKKYGKLQIKELGNE